MIEIFLIILAVSLSLVTAVYTVFLISIIHGGLREAPFVPSNSATYKKMIEVADIQKGDIVYDLGCGDGRLVFAAADKGAQAIGIEISWFIALLARVRAYFLGKKGKIICGSLWNQDLRDADIIFCYLLPPAMKSIRKKFSTELKRGCKIICHAFPLPDWEVHRKIPAQKSPSRGSVWMHIVN